MTGTPETSLTTSPQGGVVGIVTAAGSGTRLGLNKPKCFATLNGRALVELSVQAMLAGGADHVVVTAPLGFVSDVVAYMNPLWPVTVVEGSPLSRQASVAAGLRVAATFNPAIILVHDAARPLTPPAVVERVINAVRAGHDAVIPALPVTDTIKEIRPEKDSLTSRLLVKDEATAGRDNDGDVEYVVGTPQRSTLRAVHTPQGFRAEVLVAAHEAASERGNDEALAASDDAALVEWLGRTVSVVPSDPLAMKVTTRLDLMVAQMLMEDPEALR
ncbi:IspD/TarI family cytidylyltransferase [Actinomyces vulturis]|uniref:IspD/TarI family cytidylyltransferase n=1 Tax=Actinomyces vulturis TaxID=1857645 RepID=UPI00082D6871|nr:IspD/TarI family cytidylyltransferase [Actinomyces vulturis]